VKLDPDYLALIDECHAGQLATAAVRVTQQLKRADGLVVNEAMAAHWALRKGQFAKAKWFIEAALGKDQNNWCVYADELLYTYAHQNYPKFWQQWNASLVAIAPVNHPIQLLSQIIDLMSAEVDRAAILGRLQAHPYTTAAIHLPCFAFLKNANLEMPVLSFEAGIGERSLETVQILIEQTDYFLALLVARWAACLAPNDANTFAALGMAELVNGFDEWADRYLHEAEFRKATAMDAVNLYRYRIFMKQGRWIDAAIMAQALMAQQALPFKEFVSYLDCAFAKDERAYFEAGLSMLRTQFSQDERLTSTLAYLQLRQALRADEISTAQALTVLEQNAQPNNACAHYLAAQLLEPADPTRAQAFAMAGINLDPYHLDSQRWQKQVAHGSVALEWMGIFIPKNHEGAAWPSAHHEALLRLIFDTPSLQLATQWTQLVSDYPLGSLDAGSNRLLPFLHKRLETQLGPVEGAHREVLRGVWKKSFFENAGRISTLMDLQAHFENENISMVLLKGIANSLDLYGDLGSRPMADLDLLVKPPEVNSVHQILTRLGWHSDDPPVLPRVRFQYASTYRHTGGGMVDIHWRPCEDFVSDHYDPMDLGEFYTLEIQGRSFSILNPTLNLLTTILHGVAWNHLPPVRWVCDARLLLDKYGTQINWQRMLALAKKYQCVDALVLGLQYLQRHTPKSFDLAQAADIFRWNDFAQTPLIRIRTQSRSRLANAEEIIATVEMLRRKLILGPHDLILAAGGEQPSFVRARCELREIKWLPQYDPSYGDSYFGNHIDAYNVVTVDGAHACLLRLNARF